MAWINLFTNDLWTNRGSPTIYVSLDYDKQRVGADMQYKLRCTINSIGGQNYFGYPIYIKASFDGSELINYTMKNASPSQWSRAIVYESGWVTVAGKVTGTTALTTTIYSGLGSSRSEIYSHALAIDGAPSTFSLSEGAIFFNSSDSITVNISRSSTTFYHRIVVRLGTAVHVIDNVQTSSTFTLPPSWCAQLPNTTSGVGSITVETYASNGSFIGSNVSSFTGVVQGDVIPSFSSIGVQRIDGVVPSSWGKYVEGLSKVKLTINNPVGAYGSTIKSYSISGQNLSVTTASGTSDFIKASGTLTYTAKITDSRNRTATKTISIAVEAYKLPSLSGSTKAYRSDADGVSQPISGTNLAVNPIVSSYNIGGLNVDTVTIRYKLANASSFGGAVEIPKNTLSVIYQDLFDIAERYVVQFNIRDNLGANVYVEFTIPSAQRLMNFDSENHAIAFGGFVQEPNLAEFQMPVKFEDGKIDSNLLYGNTKSGTKNTYTDFNDLWESGFYDIANGVNRPFADETSWSWIINCAHRSNSPNYKYGMQIAGADNKQRFAMRTTGSTGAGPWAELYHTGNLNIKKGSIISSASVLTNLNFLLFSHAELTSLFGFTPGHVVAFVTNGHYDAYQTAFVGTIMSTSGLYVRVAENLGSSPRRVNYVIIAV